MRLQNRIIALILLCSSIVTSPSVVLLADLSEEVHAIVENAQENFKKLLDEAKDGTGDYRFVAGAYQPHLSLAYVSYGKESVEQMQEKEPSLISKLAALATRYKQINLNASLQKAHLECWQGKFEFETDGKKIKNYYNVVIKLAPSQELNALITDMDAEFSELTSYPSRTFPFSAHLTLGRLYESSDKDVTFLAEQIKKLAAEKGIINVMDARLIVEHIILSGHDGSSLSYNLA